MNVAVVPVKRLSTAKSRLAPALTSTERRDLVLALLERTVEALEHSSAIDRIALVSPEPDLGRLFRIDVIADAGNLNASLAAGAQWAAERGASLLILPADLPLIHHEDIAAIVDPAPTSLSIAIAPTWDGGTGALLLSPPQVIPPSFGPGSFARHLDAATRAGVPAHQVKRDAFKFDLDTLDDFRALRIHLPPSFARASS